MKPVISRAWAMPDRWTFKIQPVADLLSRYVTENWADPFAGETSPAYYTNDIHPDAPTKYHLEATDFVKQLPIELSGVLFDPPYSLEQCKRVYESVHRTFTMRDGQICGRWTEIKDILSQKIKLGGYAICFGWNSEGFGIGRGFELEEILLVAHGSGHNDTIVTVERKHHTQAVMELNV